MYSNLRYLTVQIDKIILNNVENSLNATAIKDLRHEGYLNILPQLQEPNLGECNLTEFFKYYS